MKFNSTIKKLDPKKVELPYDKLTEKEQYSIYLTP